MCQGTSSNSLGVAVFQIVYLSEGIPCNKNQKNVYKLLKWLYKAMKPKKQMMPMYADCLKKHIGNCFREFFKMLGDKFLES